MHNEKIPTLGDLLQSGDLGELISSKSTVMSQLDEINSIRKYLTGNYGPFSKMRILTGKETTLEMVQKVGNYFKNINA